MKVWALWHGGSSYAAPKIPDDVEEFASIAAAGRDLQERAENFDRRTPCVDREETEMQLFFKRPQQDAYPDMLLRLGPRGGVCQETA